MEWGGRQLSDGVEDVFMFLDDSEGMSGEVPEREELPTGVITLLTKCYAPSCVEGEPCYAYGCPRRASVSSLRSLSIPSLTWRQSHVVPQELPSEPPEKPVCYNFAALFTDVLIKYK